MKYIKILFFLLFLNAQAFAGQTFNPFTGKFDKCITMEEIDGDPSSPVCGKIKVTNGALADNGDGTYTLTTGLGGGGDVSGPAASVDNAIVRFDGTTGKIIQDYTSGAPTCSDTGDCVFKLLDGNGAAPTTDGQIKFDRTTERLQVGDGTGTNEFYAGAHTTDTTLNLAGNETITGNWVNTANPWADNEVSDTLTASLSTTAAADTNTTAIATTAFVQQEINGAGGTNLTCSGGVCNVDDAFLSNTGDVGTGAYDFGGATIEIDNGTIASLPAAGTVGRIAVVTDGNADNDCTTGGGSTVNVCVDDGTNWVIAGDGTAASGADSISIDGAAVVDPDFVSTGDIDFVDTSNTVTANINAGVIVNADINASAAIDVSKTALVAGTNITLATNTLNVDDSFLLNTGDVGTGTYDFGGASVEVPNSTSLPATCTVGQIYMDTDATSGQRIYACESTDTWALQGDGGGGGTSRTNLTLPVQSAKLTGSFVTMTPAGCSTTASTSAAIDAGDGNWRLLLEADSAVADEAAVWQFVMPDNYSSTPVLKVHYSMASATSGTVEYEAAIMCVSDADAADVGTASFANCVAGNATVPGTAGYQDVISITLTDDSCAAGDMVWIWLSTDADDATNDTATGDREVIGVEFSYTGI